MAYTTVNKPSDYFNTKLYTGNGSTQSITGVGFQPDLVWLKERSSTSNHQLGDAVRGATKYIQPNTTDGEGTDSNRFSSFNSDGFTQGANNGVNESGQTYASWNWKANGQGSSNTDGSINTTYTSVNTTAGFSISTYTGNGTNNATIGHGLGAVPKMMIFKILSSADDWTVYHASLGATKKIDLNSTGATSTVPEIFNDTEPTSSLITFGTHGRTNTNGQNYIVYCFAEKTGYSKFGSYVGNNNADGNFVYLGFKPAFVIAKNSTQAGYSWELFDNKRNTTDGVGNVIQKRLFPDSSSGDNGSSSTNFIDFLSNGFKIRRAGDSNASGDTYIYYAVAEAPLVGSNNTPCIAR